MESVNAHNKDTIPLSKTEQDAKTPTDFNPKKEFEKMVKHYLESNPVSIIDRKKPEMEIRFGTGKNAKPISKIDYDNIIITLYSAGFVCKNTDGMYSLRISNEYFDKTGTARTSNIRAEIVGIDMIKAYCETNNIQKLLDMPSTATYDREKIHFTQKTSIPVETRENGKHEMFRAVDFDDFGFRVAYQMEQIYTPHSQTTKDIINKWTETKKTFRHMNRVQFVHPDLPVKADLSIVRTSTKNAKKYGNRYIPTYTIQDAGVFMNEQHYEIELEIDNEMVGINTKYDTFDKLITAIRKTIRIILGALQGSNYPISFFESNRVINDYMELVYGKDHTIKRIMGKHFIGPSPVTLQMENVVDPTETTNVPCIRTNYCVTDKADGERRLMYIDKTGKIYMISTGMSVLYTGAYTENKEVFNTLLDGEHIVYDKNGNNVNVYACFDIYYRNGKSVREYPFMYSDEESETKHYRLLLLQKCVDLIHPKSIVSGNSGEKELKTPCSVFIKCKKFSIANNTKNIFECAAEILNEINMNTYEYNTDGLIYTPIHTGVGGEKEGHTGALQKITWHLAFKWKPVEYNTIDFLVSIKKDKSGRDEVHNYVDRNNAILTYKTLVLRCGFDRDRDGYIDPFNQLLHGTKKEEEGLKPTVKYQPAPFIPTTPYDAFASVCNVLVNIDVNGNLMMRTEEGDYFEDHTIVEFKYDITKENGWRWIPLRVRYDKTTELRQGLPNYGNSYNVANQNWKSIHNPVTEEMVRTGAGIPQYVEDDIYYNTRNVESNTKGLRDFHNRYIKRKLVLAVSQRKDNLIDFAVGKAGDLSKWIDAKLGFVFGIDVARDNIHNSLNGACARYLSKKEQSNIIPDALFVVGNSGLNIREGKAFNTDKDKQVANAVFGTGAKDMQLLGKNVYAQYGVGAKGFQVSSCQFAIHYFFENAKTLHEFARNVAECTSVGGHFIGTCYDGQTVFNMLKSKLKEESYAIYLGGQRIFEIKKMYDQTGFPDDETGLGYAIEVFQETIGKMFREYLVNFELLQRTMENYGFVLMTDEDAQNAGLISGSAMFRSMYESMIRENTENKQSVYGEAMNMVDEEKQISFLNRYFVFKKVREISSASMRRIQALLAKEDGGNESDDTSDDDRVGNIHFTRKRVDEAVDGESNEKKDGKEGKDSKSGAKDDGEGDDDDEYSGKNVIEILEHPKIEIDEYEPVAEVEETANEKEEKESNEKKTDSIQEVNIDMPKETAPFTLAPKSKVSERKIIRRAPKK
jgi:hypothetical protein